jgi:ribosomal protein S18 acetylase RimI-like enzyme
MPIREYLSHDLSAVRTCFIELQEFERALDPRLPRGAPIADRYLDALFLRNDEFTGKVFVAEDDGWVVGYVSVLGDYRSDAPDDDPSPFAYVDDLVVLPEHRHRGCGRALLDQAEAYAAAQGRTSLRLRVKGGNYGAREFYARAGFAEHEIELEKELP